jgi:hypothetical protein
MRAHDAEVGQVFKRKVRSRLRERLRNCVKVPGQLIVGPSATFHDATSYLGDVSLLEALRKGKVEARTFTKSSGIEFSSPIRQPRYPARHT